jgi:hypothetical protein
MPSGKIGGWPGVAVVLSSTLAAGSIKVEREILRGVYPEPPELAEGRRAQNDK